jgi:hypothetical protein
MSAEPRTKLRDTKLGIWLREKAPHILDKVGDVLPDEGALGIVKNLIESDEKDAAYVEAMRDAELAYQQEVSKRWEADMKSDNTLAKMIRPITLVALLVMYIGLAVVDSIGTIDFEVKAEYIDLLQILSMTAFGAYFAGRSMEKTKK